LTFTGGAEITLARCQPIGVRMSTNVPFLNGCVGASAGRKASAGTNAPSRQCSITVLVKDTGFDTRHLLPVFLTEQVKSPTKSPWLSSPSIRYEELLVIFFGYIVGYIQNILGIF
jgi:hypothetical protein